MIRSARYLLFLGCASLTSAGAAETLPLLFADGFEHGFSRWQSSDPDPAKPSWEIVETRGPGGKLTKALRTTGKSVYEPPHRSPPNFALVKDLVVGDFEITADVQSTNVDAGAHRDMCIFWGYQDPAHFYYVHFGAQADPHACQIFIVNDAPRTAITLKQAKGTPWTTGWHKVKVVRCISDGVVDVYFDDLKQPFMTARDEKFKYGRVGLGTFDDNGNWDNFQLRGVEVKPKEESAPKIKAAVE